jgi:hypothetical protein
MIVGMVGDMGSGKTLLMTMLLKQDFDNDRTILCNYHLNFKYELLKVKKLIDEAKNNKQLKNLTLGLDELHISVDARTSMSKRNRIFSYLVTQTRKRSVDLYYTTQFFDQVEKRVRQNTVYIFRCKRLKENMFYYRLYKKSDDFTLGEESGFIPKNAFIIRGENAKEIYKLYDTEEMIMDFGDEE